MLIDPTQYGEFLCKHKLTPNQFWLCYLIHLDDKDMMYEYLKNVGKFSKDDIKVLEQKGFIFNNNPEDEAGESKYAFKHFIATSTFKELIFVDSSEAFQELWNSYPDYLNIENKRIPAKSVDYDALEKVYSKLLKNDLVLHKEIVSLVKSAVTNNKIQMGIEKFVKSRQWEALRNEISDQSKFDFGEDV
jgi:hypothetical protein